MNMKFKSYFLLVGLATLMIASVAVAQGQTNRAAGLKRRIADQVVTGARKPTGDQPKKDLKEDDNKSGNYAPKNALAGTWDLVLTFGDGSQARSTLQIILGAADGEGSALHASEFSLAPPNPTLPEQGSWRNVRKNKFIASYYGYSFDELLQPFGKIGFRHAITLSPDQETFTGEAVFEVLDLTGQVLFSDTITTSGTRQHAEAP
jgi:hypothetical protein